MGHKVLIHAKIEAGERPATWRSVSMGTADVPRGVPRDDIEGAEAIWRYLGALGVATLGGVTLSNSEFWKLEDAFVQHVGEYSARKGITRAEWLEAGVPGDVLDRAGIT
jgi:hypothetical protein